MIQFLTDLLNKKPVILQLLRFIAIGALNTAIDFVILNLLTESLHIQEGARLGFINIVGTTAAIIQSYYWNKYWAFASGVISSVFKQFALVVVVGALGFFAFLAAILPSLSVLLASRGLPAVTGAGSLYFALVLIVFLLAQIVIGSNIGFRAQDGGQMTTQTGATSEFGKFIGVSIVGVIINSIVLTILVAVILHTYPSVTESLAKNLAKFIAVFVALTWNFIGYKFFVFRR